MRPVARGETEFDPAEVRFSRRWDCGGRRSTGQPSEVRVYPNFRALAKYTLLATDNRLSQIGVLQVRRRGEERVPSCASTARATHSARSTGRRPRAPRA